MSTDTKPPVIFLPGDRIYLRPNQASDVEGYQRWINEPDTRRYMRVFRPMTEKMEREFVENPPGGETAVHLAIVLKDGDRHIGGTGFHNIRWKDRNAEWGIFIGPPEERSKGYGSEAARIMLQYGFETLNFHRIELIVYSFNAAGIRAYEKLGFVREGARRESVFCDGQYADEMIYGMLAREYQARR